MTASTNCWQVDKGISLLRSFGSWQQLRLVTFDSEFVGTCYDRLQRTSSAADTEMFLEERRKLHGP